MSPHRIGITVGPLEPIIRAALLAACAAHVEISESPCRGRQLVEQGRRARSAAVVCAREDLVDLCGRLPLDILAIGVSTASWTLLLASGSVQAQIANPPPEMILRLIREWNPEKQGI